MLKVCNASGYIVARGLSRVVRNIYKHLACCLYTTPAHVSVVTCQHCQLAYSTKAQVFTNNTIMLHVQCMKTTPPDNRTR
jgi:hypothetical protein